MMRVRLRLNERRFQKAAAVAAQTQRVAAQPRSLQRTRMTIQARNARLAHLAAEKSRELIVLSAYLAVGIKRVPVIHDREIVVIIKSVAGLEVSGQVRAQGVA